MFHFKTLLALFLAAYLGGQNEKPTLDVRPYPFDSAHCILDFTVDLALVGRVRGTFQEYTGVILYDPHDLTRSSVSLAVDVSSVDTGVKMRDNHLKEEDFFDAESHPKIRFQSQRVEKTRDGHALVGPLTIKGVTRTTRIPFQVQALDITDPFGNKRMIFSGRLVVDRHEFGVSGPDFWNRAIGDQVTVDFTIGARVYNYSRIGFREGDKPSLGSQIMEAHSAGGIEEVRKLTRKVFAEKPEGVNYSAREIYVAGMRLFQTGHERDAIALFEETLRSHPDLSHETRSSLHSRLGEFYAVSGDLDEARNHLENALQLDQENLEAAEMLRHFSSL